MLLGVWMMVGLIALAFTGVALASLSMGADAMGTYGGVIAFVSWAVWAFGALDLQVSVDAGVIQQSAPSVALLGVVFALASGYIALKGPIELMNRRVEGPEQL
jgi:hypothetical protein